MKIYIAASSREVDRVRRAQELAVRWGWKLTLDWLTPMEANRARGVSDTDLTASHQAIIALEDLAAIESSDLVWLLSPREPTIGAWWEASHASAKGIPVVVSGCTAKTLPSIFVAVLPTVPRDEDVRALAEHLGRAA